MRLHSRFLLLAAPLAAVLIGCREDPAIEPANEPPVADARVVRDGKKVDEETDGPDALKFEYSGTPVTITLDGSESHDTDGKVTGYQWFSGTLAPDGGIPLPDDMGVSRRWVPPNAPPDWPEDVVAPQVELDEGIWAFTLWVLDDDGAISTPDPIKITIGSVVDPVVQQCSDNVLDTEPGACRQCMCGQGDMCRAAVTADVCDQTCWDLVNCANANCPDIAQMLKDMDYSCLAANCAELASGPGAIPAIAAGECARACPTECAPGAAGTSDGGP